MERKIGEIFKHNGEWYQCVGGCHCPDCAFCNNNCEERERITLGNKLTKEETTGFCTPEFREDGKSVIFKKLEKVGEPYKYIDGIYQQYKATLPFFIRNATYIETGDGFAIKIKQNKEDMEEKKVRLKKEDIDFLYNKFIEIIEECVVKGYNIDNVQHEFGKLFLMIKDSDTKLNLKPFDLEAAKAGKPVCTRDGRKARIICFDKKKDIYPLIALVTDKDGYEIITPYKADGVHPTIPNNDLMMLPEKKEGWVNVYRDCDGANITKDDNIYSSKDAAISSAQMIDKDNYVATTIIEWEE